VLFTVNGIDNSCRAKGHMCELTIFFCCSACITG